MDGNNEELNNEVEMDSVSVLRGELAITPDKPEYKYFCTQFAKALERWHTPQANPPKVADNGHWFGKLIAFPYSIVNFENGGPATDRKTGQEFWDLLKDGTIKVTKFELTDIMGDYQEGPPSNGFKTATVTMRGVISYEKKRKDGTVETITDRAVKVFHNLEQTWYAKDSTFELA